VEEEGSEEEERIVVANTHLQQQQQRCDRETLVVLLQLGCWPLCYWFTAVAWLGRLRPQKVCWCFFALVNRCWELKNTICFRNLNRDFSIFCGRLFYTHTKCFEMSEFVVMFSSTWVRLPFEMILMCWLFKPYLICISCSGCFFWCKAMWPHRVNRHERIAAVDQMTNALKTLNVSLVKFPILGGGATFPQPIYSEWFVYSTLLIELNSLLMKLWLCFQHSGRTRTAIWRPRLKSRTMAPAQDRVSVTWPTAPSSSQARISHKTRATLKL